MGETIKPPQWGTNKLILSVSPLFFALLALDIRRHYFFME